MARGRIPRPTHLLSDDQWAQTWEYVWGLEQLTYAKGDKDQPGSPGWRRDVREKGYDAGVDTGRHGEEIRWLSRKVRGKSLVVVPASQVGEVLHAIHVLSPHCHHSRHATQKAVRGNFLTVRTCYEYYGARIAHISQTCPSQNHVSTPPPLPWHCHTGASTHSLPRLCHRCVHSSLPNMQSGTEVRQQRLGRCSDLVVNKLRKAYMNVRGISGVALVEASSCLLVCCPLLAV